MKQFNNLTMKNNGLTLIEMLVAVTVFATIIGAISGVFISGVRVQRRVLATQEILDQTSYLMEYMGRALRMAKKDLTGNCLTAVGAGYNYEITADGIKFIDYHGVCTEFHLDAEQLKKTTDGTTLELTSDTLQVNSFKVNLSGEYQGDSLSSDDLQPRATIFLEIENKRIAQSPPRIQIQTSISQRDLDVRY